MPTDHQTQIFEWLDQHRASFDFKTVDQDARSVFFRRKTFLEVCAAVLLAEESGLKPPKSLSRFLYDQASSTAFIHAVKRDMKNILLYVFPLRLLQTRGSSDLTEELLEFYLDNELLTCSETYPHRYLDAAFSLNMMGRRDRIELLTGALDLAGPGRRKSLVYMEEADLYAFTHCVFYAKGLGISRWALRAEVEVDALTLEKFYCQALADGNLDGALEVLICKCLLDLPLGAIDRAIYQRALTKLGSHGSVDYDLDPKSHLGFEKSAHTMIVLSFLQSILHSQDQQIAAMSDDEGVIDHYAAMGTMARMARDTDIERLLSARKALNFPAAFTSFAGADLVHSVHGDLARYLDLIACSDRRELDVFYMEEAAGATIGTDFKRQLYALKEDGFALT